MINAIFRNRKANIRLDCANKTYMLTDGKFSEGIFSEGIAELLRFEPLNCRVTREP